jgi:anthranilate phosphoribosyltransferase
VLTELGVNVQVSAEVSERCLNEIGICFLFAPLYHQATKRVADIRRQLGVHTTFNLLGPLTNPAGAPRQIIGVWDRALLEPLAHTLSALGRKRAWVMHGSDGLDEVTTSGHTYVAQVNDGAVSLLTIEPADFGLAKSDTLDQLRGGSAKENAAIISAVFDGERGGRLDAARDLITANAAAALHVGGTANDLHAAADLARESIASGAAKRMLSRLVEATTAATS